MEKLSFKIIEPIGVHAKVAASIVNIASQYESDIFLISEEETANMKSILNILALGISNGTKITIDISGNDEYKAAQDIMNFILQHKIGIVI